MTFEILLLEPLIRMRKYTPLFQFAVLIVFSFLRLLYEYNSFPMISYTLTIELNGIIPLGTITKNTIIPSQPLLNNIIPKKEEIFYWGSFPSLPASKMTFYWEVFNILPKSINRCKQYKLLFN